jgi:integrase
MLTQRIGETDVETMSALDIEKYKESRIGEGRSRGTVNIELGLLRCAINIARKHRLIACSPEIELFPPAPPRRGFLHAHEAERLLFALECQDSDVADAVRFLWGLGWRCSEVTGLTWDEANAPAGAITLSPERSKTKDPRTVKLHGELRDLLIKRWNARQGPWVFHRNGRPIRDFRGVWLRACKVCSKSGLLVHDLRRSFARHAMRAGVPQPVIMEIAGWKTASVFRRYAIVDETIVEDALRKISAYREG